MSDLPVHIESDLPIHIEAVKRELQAIRSLVDAKDFHNKARALEACAALANDEDLLAYAREVRIRAKRRAGELIGEMKAEGRIKHGGDRKSKSRSAAKSAGVTKQFASEAQRLAEAPEDDFERAVANAKSVKDLTERFVAREAKRSRVDRAAASNAWPFRGQWTPEAIENSRAWLDQMPNGEALAKRLATDGVRQKDLSRMIEHCSGASREYLEAAVDRLLGGGDAAMLYGDPPPLDPLGSWIRKAVGELPEISRGDPRVEIIRTALREAYQVSVNLREEEEERWRRLYSEAEAALPMVSA